MSQTLVQEAEPHPDTPEVPLVDRGYDVRVGTELYLVRHGESMTNVYRNLVAYDPNLTALGWEQALRVGAWMAEHAPVDVVVTSPLRRAHSTALAIAHAQKVELTTVAGLEEFSQVFWDEIPPHHPTQPWLGRTDWTPDFERQPSFVAFRDRIYAALSEALTTYIGQRICMVSHGGAMDVLTAAMVGAAQLSAWTNNTGVSHFIWPEWRRWNVHYINRTEHLIGLNADAYPRAPEASRDEDGFWTVPDRLVDSWSALPVKPDLAFMSNALNRSDRVLFLHPPDPITPLRVSIRTQRAAILSNDLSLLEAGELRRAALNANHIRFQYLFLPLPYPDDYFDYAVLPAESTAVEEEVSRVLRNPAGRIRWRTDAVSASG